MDQAVERFVFEKVSGKASEKAGKKVSRPAAFFVFS
jgi:hypothetical protein